MWLRYTKSGVFRILGSAYLFVVFALMFELFLTVTMLLDYRPDFSYRGVFWILGIVYFIGVFGVSANRVLRDTIVYLHSIAFVLVAMTSLSASLTHLFGLTKLTYATGFGVAFLSGAFGLLVLGKLIQYIPVLWLLKYLSVSGLYHKLVGFIQSHSIAKPARLDSYTQQKIAYTTKMEHSLTRSVSGLWLTLMASSGLLKEWGLEINAVYSILANNPEIVGGLIENTGIDQTLIFKPIQEVIQISQALPANFVWATIMSAMMGVLALQFADRCAIGYKHIQIRLIARCCSPTPQPNYLKELLVLVVFDIPLLILAVGLIITDHPLLVATVG